MNNEEKINIVVVSNEKYLKYSVPLVRSISKNCTNFTIHLFLINSHSKKLDKKLLKRVGNIKIYKIFKNFDSEDDEAGFCANYRFSVIPELLRDSPGNLIYLDADSIVRCDLSKDEDIKNYFERCDIALMTSKRFDNYEIIDINSEDVRGQKRTVAFKTGVLVISNNDNTKLFFDDVRKNLSVYGENKWYTDQLSFFDSVENFSEVITLMQIESYFFGLKLRNSDKIWIIKGDKYRDHPKYIEAIESLTI